MSAEPSREKELGTRRRLTLRAVRVLVALAVVGSVVWALYIGREYQAQGLVHLLRAKNLRMLHVALANYADDHGRIPPAHTVDSFGKPMQSWRVSLLPYLDRESLFSRIHQNEPWDSPSNRQLLAQMPGYYRSPLQPKTDGIRTDYFAVVGPNATWWGAEGGKPWKTNGGPDAVLLIEIPGLDTEWMKPWDPTVDEVLDSILQPDGNQGAGGNRAGKIMYITVHAVVHTVDSKADRDNLRDLLLSEPRFGIHKAHESSPQIEQPSQHQDEP